MNRDPLLDPRLNARRDVSVREEKVVEEPVIPAAGEAEEVVQTGPGIQRRERIVRTPAGDEHAESVVNDAAGSQWLWLSKLSQIVWLIIGIIEILIGLRVILRLVAANPDNSFAAFIYNASAPFLAPFFGLVGSPAFNGSVLEIASLIAMAVYLLLGWLLVEIIWLAERPLTGGATRYHRYHF
jgi:YggT family protein